MSLNVTIRKMTYTTLSEGASVLRDVHFATSSGESVGILGRNGCGKTSLAYAIAGIVPRLVHGAVDGEIEYRGVQLAQSSTRNWLTKVGVLFQDCDSQFFSLRVGDEFPNSDVVDQFGLHDFLDRSPSELSMGQRQKVALAVAVAKKPEMLILDEPGTTLDPPSRRRLMEILKRLRDSGMEMLVLSQRQDGILGITSRVLGLKNGGVCLDCPREALTTNAVADLFEIDVASVEGMPPAAEVTGSEGKEVTLCEGIEFWYSGTPFRLVIEQPLVVRQGTVLGLAGANGSGKSTILYVLAGLLKARRGSTFVSTSLAKSKWRAAIVFQNPNHQIFGRSLREEIVFGLENLGLPRQEIEQRVAWSQDFFELGDLARDPHTLSYGQRKILALACAFVMEPDVVLLDEPELGLDLHYRVAVEGLIREWRKTRGTSFVIASHDLDLMKRETQALALIDNGKVVSAGPTREVFAAVCEHFGTDEHGLC